MSKRKILLYADSFQGRIGISEPYVDFLSQFGEIILVGPTNDLDLFVQLGDVLAMPGGADIDPSRYEEVPWFAMNRTNPHYEFLDRFLLTKWLATGKPIIGICRGMQSLNVALGGSLFQHIINHVGDEERTKCDQELFTDIEGFEYYEVNSYHHQAVKKLGEGLKVIGWASVYRNCPSLREVEHLLLRHSYEYNKKTGDVSKVKKNNKDLLYRCIPEIIQHESKPYIGFQYHPEEFNCQLAVKLISEMLEQE